MTEPAPFNYAAEAEQTKSDKFYGELVCSHQMRRVLISCIENLQLLDAIKKALFYGKPNEMLEPPCGPSDCAEMYSPNIGDEPHQGADIIHSILGKATESGELLEALFKSVFEGEKFDVVNFKEEIGDGMWYDAIGLNAIGVTIDQAQRINIEKLRKRFPNKFTEYDAQNRDLFAEREILEK